MGFLLAQHLKLYRYSRLLSLQRRSNISRIAKIPLEERGKLPQWSIFEEL